jgi:hypothetical protein
LNTRNNETFLLGPTFLEHLSLQLLAILPYKKSQTDFEDEVVRMGHYWNNGLLPKVRTKMIEKVKVQTHFQHIKIIMYSPCL